VCPRAASKHREGLSLKFLMYLQPGSKEHKRFNVSIEILLIKED
jgi:hypothetical protein